MTDMQKKIMVAVRKAITDADLECVEKWSWGNVGDLYVQRHGDFNTFFTIHVNFQDNRMSAAILFDGEHLCNGFAHKGNEMVHSRSFLMNYTEGDKLKAFFTKIAKEAALGQGGKDLGRDKSGRGYPTFEKLR